MISLMTELFVSSMSNRNLVSIEKYGSSEVHGQFVMRLCGRLTWMFKHALVGRLTVDMAGSAVESNSSKNNSNN